MASLQLLLLLVSIGLFFSATAAAAACQSCVAPLPFLPLRHGRRKSVHGLVRASSVTLPFLGLVSGRQLTEKWVKRVGVQRHVVMPALIVAGVWATRTAIMNTLLVADESTSSSDGDEAKDTPGNSNANKKSDDVSSAMMIGTIKFYKSFISPLLPPACRFLPTCSLYGVQAIEEFGPTKGAILTAWRLLRCSPLGGRGYDPPRWPPVFYTYGSY